jgi:hypothetical protein
MTNVPISTSTIALDKKPIVLWDVILTLALLLGGFIAAIVIGISAISLGFAPGENCAGCADNQIFFGVVLAMFGPPVIYLLAIVITVIRLIKRQIAFWVPIVGVVGGLGLWAAGAALVFTGIPGFTFQ